jgi:hypothetical protein
MVVPEHERRSNHDAAAPPHPVLRSARTALSPARVSLRPAAHGLRPAAHGLRTAAGTTTLDMAEAERQIAQLTEEQSGVAPTDVSCPADVEARSGATFSCSASVEDQPITFTVTQTDDEGNVRIDGDNTFVDVATVEASLDEQLGEVAEVAVVSTCETDGHTVLVDGVGTPIPCTVVNAGDTSDSVEVTATVDENGDVSYEVG